MATLESKLIVSLMDRVSGPARGLLGTMGRLRAAGDGFYRQQQAMAAPLLGVSRSLLAFGGTYLGVNAGVRGTAGAAMRFESAMADVAKVLDVSDTAFENIRRDILALSKQMPVSAEGFASIYAAAAQSNVAQRELKGFAEGVVRVSTAWDTAVGATGESLAKIKTALGRDLAGTFKLADAMNHVSNVSAASAPDMLDYTNRVAAFAETAGFSAEQALAFGGAMVGSGFEPDVAATSFRNLTRSLTIGERATKQQRIAMKALGLEATKTAKNMQKNAVETTLDVFERLKQLPAEQQISMASALFGDEARALAPLIRSTDELRRLLRETGSEANYAGSAFEEYRKRAATSANTLQRLKNNAIAVGIGIGDAMLPKINEAMEGILKIFDTLGERATIFNQIGTGVEGFLKGLDYDGGLDGLLKDVMKGVEEFVFGTVNGSEAADKLGRIFEQSRQWGASLRELNAAIKDSPLGDMLSEIGGYAGTALLASLGIGLLGGAVKSLASALWLLSGAKLGLSVLRGVASIGAAAIGGLATGGGKPPPGAPPPGKPRPTPPKLPPRVPKIPPLAGGPLASAAALAMLMYSLKDYEGGVWHLATPKGRPSGLLDSMQRRRDIARADARKQKDDDANAGLSRFDLDAQAARARGHRQEPVLHPEVMNDNLPRSAFQQLLDSMKRYADEMMKPQAALGPDEVSILGTPTVNAPPVGVQPVTVTNPPPRPHITVNMGGIHVTGVNDPEKLTDQIAQILHWRVKSQLDGLFANTGYGVA